MESQDCFKDYVKKKKRTVELLKTDHKMEIKMDHGDTEN